ncbi:hypothetical protein ACFX13_029847 [Malus domestica]
MRCKMHDIVSDYVQFITKKECLITKAKGANREIEVLGSKLHGSLTVRILGKVKNGRQVSEAHLRDKKQLFHLVLSFGEGLDELGQSNVRIMNVLRSHDDLESLVIYGYVGSTLPNWLMSLNKLRFLTLQDNSACELTPIGRLRFFEKLPGRTGKNLSIFVCLKLAEHCKEGSGDEWHKISHIPNIKILNIPSMANRHIIKDIAEGVNETAWLYFNSIELSFLCDPFHHLLLLLFCSVSLSPTSATYSESKSSSNKVMVELYYETLCPNSYQPLSMI